MNKAIVSHIRNVELDRIMMDPAYIQIDGRPEVDNGYGVMVKKLNAPQTWIEKGPVRIVARTHPILSMTGMKALFSQTTGQSEVYGIGNDFVLFAPYDVSWLKSGLVFKHNGRTYKTFEPHRATMFGEVISVFCMLKDVGRVG